MPSILAKLMLFLSSYIPLFVVVMTLNKFETKSVWIPFSILSIASFLSLVGFLKLASTMTKKIFEVKDTSFKDSESMSYLVSYIIPFMADFSSGQEMFKNIALGIVFLVIGTIYVKSGLIQINPILNLLGYHVHEIQNISDERFFLISKRKSILIGSKFHAVQITPNIILE